MSPKIRIVESESNNGATTWKICLKYWGITEKAARTVQTTRTTTPLASKNPLPTLLHQKLANPIFANSNFKKSIAKKRMIITQMTAILYSLPFTKGIQSNATPKPIRSKLYKKIDITE